MPRSPIQTILPLGSITNGSCSAAAEMMTSQTRWRQFSWNSTLKNVFWHSLWRHPLTQTRPAGCYLMDMPSMTFAGVLQTRKIRLTHFGPRRRDSNAWRKRKSLSSRSENFRKFRFWLIIRSLGWLRSLISGLSSFRWSSFQWHLPKLIILRYAHDWILTVAVTLANSVTRLGDLLDFGQLL